MGSRDAERYNLAKDRRHHTSVSDLRPSQSPNRRSVVHTAARLTAVAANRHATAPSRPTQEIVSLRQSSGKQLLDLRIQPAIPPIELPNRRTRRFVCATTSTFAPI